MCATSRVAHRVRRSSVSRYKEAKGQVPIGIRLMVNQAHCWRCKRIASAHILRQRAARPDSRFQDYQIPSEHFTMHDFCHPCVCCFSYSRRSLCGINQGSDYNQGWQGRFQIPDSQIPDSSFTDIQIPDSKFQTPLLGGQGEADSRFQIPRVSGWDSGVRDKADSKFQIPESLSQG